MGILSKEGLLMLLYTLPGLLLAFSFHEFAHGYVAYKLGDPTAKNLGRLTLDPIVHIDPIGFLMLLLFRFGWAKPVPINPRNFKKPRRDEILVSLAGPSANFILAIIFAGLLRFIWNFQYPQEFLSIIFFDICRLAFLINIGLGVFNLLPIPPLDGSHILFNILPTKYSYDFMKYYGTIQIILLLLLFSGILGEIIYPIIEFVATLIISIYAYI